MRTRASFIGLLLGCVAVAVSPAGPAVAVEAYEQYYHYINDHPSCAETTYSEECQGITHSGGCWYITNNNDGGKIWRVPVGDDLSAPADCALQRSWDHSSVGSPSYHQYPAGSGTGYVLVPFINSSGTTYLDVLEVNDVGLMHVASVSLGQTNAEWVAVDSSGVLYSSEYGYVTSIKAYSVDWSQLATYELPITATWDIPLLDALGLPMGLDQIQGGVVSPGEGLLYLSTGYHSYGSYESLWGIHVYDTNSWREVARSTKGSGLFNYDFDTFYTVAEQPGGLTIWDLDDGGAPDVSGQLHVVVLQNDLLTADDVYIKHYTNVTHVDAAYSGTEEGTIPKPYNTVGEALALYGSCDWWTGGKIRIKAGTYPEVLTFNKRMQLFSRGGAATVGSFGQVRVDTLGAINVSTGAAVKLH